MITQDELDKFVKSLEPFLNTFKELTPEQRGMVISLIMNDYCSECLRLEGGETEKDCQCWNDE